jgi:hypothetical protein
MTYVYYRVNLDTRNAYAVWWVADMVIEHMKARGGAWPKSWEDLREPYAASVRTSGHPWTFEALRSRIEIDFDADPTQLAKPSTDPDGPPYRVIWLRDGSRMYWERHGPNRMVLDFLRDYKTKRPR